MHPVRYPCNAAPPPRSPTPNPQGTESLGDDLYVHIRVICFYLLWETSFVTAWKLSSHPISLLYQDFVKAAVWLYCYFVSITIPLSLDGLFSGVQKLFAFSDSRTTPAPLWLSSHILLPRCWRRRRRAGDCGWRQSATWRGVTTSLSTLSCATHERSRISMSWQPHILSLCMCECRLINLGGRREFPQLLSQPCDVNNYKIKNYKGYAVCYWNNEYINISMFLKGWKK